MNIPLSQEQLQLSINLMEIGLFVFIIYVGKSLLDFLLSKWLVKSQENYVTIDMCQKKVRDCLAVRNFEDSSVNKKLSRLERVIFHMALRQGIDETYLYSIFSDELDMEKKQTTKKKDF